MSDKVCENRPFSAVIPTTGRIQDAEVVV